MNEDVKQAALLVRKNQAELDSAKAAYNFHTKMAASQFDEIKKHRRNLDDAESNLIKVSVLAFSPSTGGGASAITPNNINQIKQGAN